MKIFVIGKHSSGKISVLDYCEEAGVRVGREFCNASSTAKLHLDKKYELYSDGDISNIFESNAYICLSGIDEIDVLDGYNIKRGISLYTYDNSDVISLHPQQLLSLNTKNINDEIIFAWLDNNLDNRIRRYADELRDYDFMTVEQAESSIDPEFVKTLYEFPNSRVLYFNNELPERVAAIIIALVKHPDLVDIFIDKYN